MTNPQVMAPNVSESYAWVAGRAATAGFSCASRTTRDADEHAEALRAWDQRYEQLTPGGFEGRLTDLWMGDIQIFREVTNQIVHQRGRAWSGAFVFGVVLDSDGEGAIQGSPLANGGGFSLGSAPDFLFRTPRCLDVVGIALSRDWIEANGNATGDSSLQDAATAPARVFRRSADLDELSAYLRELFATVEVDRSALRHPSAQRSVVSALAGVLSGAVSGGGAIRHAASRNARTRLVERAKDYVLDRRETPVTVTELCEFLCVSRRTLQYCFQDVLGVNPVQYLRAIRLNGVRRELREHVSGVRIGDVAARWGFWHFSQFSADYRRMFGELPSETLRGARA